jgi:hypothetical protein
MNGLYGSGSIAARILTATEAASLSLPPLAAIE